MMETGEYFKKIDKDLDTNDMLDNSVKLRKLYNLIHMEKIPEERLSIPTKKKFK